MSAVRVIRRARGKPSRCSGAGVLAGKLYRQALAPLFPAPGQRLATPLCLHARAKSMRLDAALVTGAVGRLTHACSERLVVSGWCEVGIGSVPTSHCPLPTRFRAVNLSAIMR